MNYPFSKEEVEVLIEYITNNRKDALRLSRYLFETLETNFSYIEPKNDIRLPNLPNLITKNNNTVHFKNPVRDFLIIFSLLVENIDLNVTLDKLWELENNAQYSNKVANYESHALVLYNKYFKKSFLFALQKDYASFWELSDAFSNILHILDVSVLELYAAFTSIHLAANGDADGTILHKLTSFAKTKPEMALSLFEKITSENAIETIHFMGPLAEGLSSIYGYKKFFDAGFTLIENGKSEYIKVGTDLLGKIKYNETSDLKKAIDTLFNLTAHKDPVIRGQSTYNLISLIEQDESVTTKICMLAEQGDDSVILQITVYIWRTSNEGYDDAWLYALAQKIAQKNSSHSHVIRYSTYYIQNLYKAGEKEKGFNLLENWVKNSKQIKDFKNCFEALATIDLLYISKRILDWFVSSNINLLWSLNYLTTLKFAKKIQFDSAGLDTYDTNQIKKLIAAIIGFVWDKDSLAILLISVLNSKHLKTIGEDIAEVFIGYVCYTYPSTLEQYIVPEIENSKGPKKIALQYIQVQVEKYREGIRSLPMLKEFSGSDRQRDDYHKAFDRKQAEAYRKADEQSIFSQLAHNIVLKTGPTFFCKIDGKYSDFDELKKFSYSFEPPRAEYIDPAWFEHYRKEMRSLALIS